MPYHVDMIFDSANNTPTYLLRAQPDLIMEYRRWPDPPNSGAMPPPMRLVFKRADFYGKYKTTGNTTTPVLTATEVIFNSGDGTVSGDDVQEVRIILKPNVAHPPGGYKFNVDMRPTLTGAWVTWDPRVVPR